MHCQIEAFAPYREQFETLERDLGVPLRVLVGSSIYGQPDYRSAPWEGQVPEEQLDVAQERGVTIIVWGMRSQSSYADIVLPEDWFVDIAPESRSVFDVAAISQQSPRAVSLDVGRVGDYVVAEIEPRVLWWGVPWHSLDIMLERGRLDFERLFADPVLRCVSDEFRQEYEDHLRQATEDVFVTLSREGKEAGRRDVRHRLTLTEEAVAQATRNLITQKTHLLDLQREFDALEASSNFDVDEIRDSWQRLLHHAKVEDASIEAGKIEVVTSFLRMTDPRTGESCPLGRFRIRLVPGNHAITMENLDLPRLGRAHPHCGQRGEPCLGSIDESVIELLSQHEYVGVLELLLQWIQSFNPRDEYGRYAGYWFDSEEARAEREAEEQEEVAA